MNEAVKAEYEHILRLRGQDAANGVFQAKGSYSDDLAAIIVNYLGKAHQFFTDDHPQTAVAILMELTKYTAVRDAYVIRCCAYQDAMNKFFNFWQRILRPGSVLRSYSVGRQHVADLQASGVDLTVLINRLQRIVDSTRDVPRLQDIADNAQDVIDTVVRLRQYRD
uniref:Uncharacterized protein n=1 Tax=Pyramimonas obovata TaxID=1411642 RepID=A0A7S0QTT8_9CHLO|mmetsp:Transcript_20201/g.44240  ORF Transcript_20201/g.44240 Transcript_20201/m.44240 type:complete len:166 (+) Transcript_20201:3-500(+)